MTDTAISKLTITMETRQRHTARRKAAERRFKALGLAAVVLALGFLVLLLSNIVMKALPAFSHNYVALSVDLSAVDGQNIPTGDYRGILGDALKKKFPYVSGRKNKRALRGILSAGASIILQREVSNQPKLAGSVQTLSIPLSDTADLYLKDPALAPELMPAANAALPTGVEDEIEIVAVGATFAPVVEIADNALRAQAAKLERQITAQGRSLASLENRSTNLEGEQKQAVLTRLETVKAKISQLNAQRDSLNTRLTETGSEKLLTSDMPSILVFINEGIVRVTAVTRNGVSGEVYKPLNSAGQASAGEWSIVTISQPESERKISDREIIWIEELRENGLIENRWNTIFFTSGASREPEMAGIWGAIVGSFLTMVVTLFMSFPIGVAAAIYLEEFAPKNRFTEFIEVNINNLAAVPSIVFGLLGLGIIVNGVQMGSLTIGGFSPRSAAVTGGMVLALMTLPTIIITARAVFKSVPPSIREAALGIGASRVQVVFHHVLPLAMPGVLTGTIIGMSRALGESAPLLMIGMVAFIVDIPGWFTDPATVLPVQIFMWADFPEIAFQQKTAAAIIILLVFLILMNALAVFLRNRFERRW